MVVCSLEVNDDIFHFKKENKELCGPKVQELNVIVTLIYLANCT